MSSKDFFGFVFTTPRLNIVAYLHCGCPETRALIYFHLKQKLFFILINLHKMHTFCSKTSLLVVR